jgi:NAD(P)-dependent dehydrogenase (short-subunit alcohol dehydrogenase family)/acyl carrier protein
MREMAEAQRQVMLRFLGEAAPDRPELADAVAEELAPALPQATVAPRISMKPSAPPSVNPSSTPSARPGAPSVRPGPASRRVARSTRPPPAPPPAHLSAIEALIATVSERTGYPLEMLDPELDLEADLGIDSIKRIEILGQMRDRLGLGTMTDAARSDALEELAKFKTLRKIADWLEARAPKAALHADAAGNGKATIEVVPSERAPVTLASPLTKAPASVTRYVLEANPVPAAVANCVRVEGRTFAMMPDRLGVSVKLAEILRAAGARVRVLAAGEEVGEVDGLLHLESLDPQSHDSVRTLFANVQAAVRGNALWVVATTGLGGQFGMAARSSNVASPGGVSGLLKSLAKERPQLRVRAIDLHPGEDPAQLAAHVYAELLADDQRVEVGYAAGVRHALQVETRALVAGPELSLDDRSVVLVTGGARGITAEVAVALARRFHCRFELVGRSALGEEEDAELARARDATAIRRLLLERANGAGPVSPANIERACRVVLGSREVQGTLARIREAGGQAVYHAADVRDAAAFGAIIDGVYQRQGRIDGVIHGAGVIEDRLIAEKTKESFDRVFDTKVTSALTLGKKLRDDVRFVAFFSSVSGAFGNRGQVDYAAANDALDKLALQLSERQAGSGGAPIRVLSVNWGPWGGVGMVSPELEREYSRRGVETIAPEQGADRFVDELCRGTDVQVILAANTLAGFV